MTVSLKLSLCVLAIGSIGLLGACKPAQEAAAPEAVAPAGPTPVFSINEMMVMIVDQPGELLWHVEKAGHAPKTDEDWYQLENHAVSLASAGTLIQLGGTGPTDMEWSARPEWKASANQMITAAQAARTAAKAKDLPALITANGQIVDACESCHKVFKPDFPTGGLFLHPQPAT